MPETSALRTHYPQCGLDIVASDVIIAIILNAKGAPELQLREVGTSSEKTSIRYGMTTDELEKVLADQPYRYEGLLDSWVPYRFYPGIGIAVRVGPQKTVDELGVSGSGGFGRVERPGVGPGATGIS